MLVSSIAKFNAINQMNNSAMNMMQTSNAMMSAANTSHTFGGEHDLSMLNKLDNKLSLDLTTNSLLYKLAYLQEKMFNKHKDADCTKKGSTFSAIA